MIAIAALVLVFWDQPTGRVIIGITLGVLVALVIIEFLGRPPSPVAPETVEPEIPADGEVSDSAPPAEPVLTGSQARDASEADAWLRCRATEAIAPPGGSAGSTRARTDVIRPSAPCGSSDRRRWAGAAGATARRCHGMPRLIRGGRPLPDIADHVDQPEPVGRKRPHRRCANPAVSARVLVREPPCQVFAINWPSGLTSSPQAYVDVLPARAAYSHSASLGRRRPAQFAYASASDRRPEPQGGRTSPRCWTQGRTDAASRHRPTSATTAASCSGRPVQVEAKANAPGSSSSGGRSGNSA